MEKGHSCAEFTCSRIIVALFGSDLEHRAEYEMGIPGIVMRCIQEVELRGMEQLMYDGVDMALTVLSRHGHRRHLP